MSTQMIIRMKPELNPRMVKPQLVPATDGTVGGNVLAGIVRAGANGRVLHEQCPSGHALPADEVPAHHEFDVMKAVGISERGGVGSTLVEKHRRPDVDSHSTRPRLGLVQRSPSLEMARHCADEFAVPPSSSRKEI